MLKCPLTTKLHTGKHLYGSLWRDLHRGHWILCDPEKVVMVVSMLTVAFLGYSLFCQEGLTEIPEGMLPNRLTFNRAVAPGGEELSIHIYHYKEADHCDRALPPPFYSKRQELRLLAVCLSSP